MSLSELREQHGVHRDIVGLVEPGVGHRRAIVRIAGNE